MFATGASGVRRTSCVRESGLPARRSSSSASVCSSAATPAGRRRPGRRARPPRSPRWTRCTPAGRAAPRRAAPRRPRRRPGHRGRRRRTTTDRRRRLLGDQRAQRVALVAAGRSQLEHHAGPAPPPGRARRPARAAGRARGRRRQAGRRRGVRARRSRAPCPRRRAVGHAELGQQRGHPGARRRDAGVVLGCGDPAAFPALEPVVAEHDQPVDVGQARRSRRRAAAGRPVITASRPRWGASRRKDRGYVGVGARRVGVGDDRGQRAVEVEARPARAGAVEQRRQPRAARPRSSGWAGPSGSARGSWSVTTTVSRLVERLPKRGRIRAASAGLRPRPGRGLRARRVVDGGRGHDAAEVADAATVQPFDRSRVATVAARPLRAGLVEHDDLRRSPAARQPCRLRRRGRRRLRRGRGALVGVFAGVGRVLVGVVRGRSRRRGLRRGRPGRCGGRRRLRVLAAPDIQGSDQRGDGEDGQQRGQQRRRRGAAGAVRPPADARVRSS